MKKIAYLLFNLMVLTSVGLSQNNANIDFGVSSLTTGKDTMDSTWNNAVWGGAGDQTPLKLVNRKNYQLGITMQRLSGFLGGYDTGDNQQTLFPSSAAKDRWSLEKGKSEEGVIRFSGFQSNHYLNIHFYGIRDAPVEFLTSYASQGQQVELNCQNNRDKIVSLKSLRPDADGNIDVKVSIASGPNGHLSVAMLQLYDSEPTSFSIPATPGGGSGSAPSPPPAPEPTAPKPPPATPPAPSPAAPEEQPEEIEEVDELAELGLEEEAGNTVLMIVGVLLIVLGIGVIIGSVWYFLKPESE
ncbi:MAG: hypothetical protein AAF571_04145 [Verrucomicrobiota bacterium]